MKAIQVNKTCAHVILTQYSDLNVFILYIVYVKFSTLVTSRESDFIVYNRAPDTESAITKYALWILQLFYEARRVLSC